MPTHQIQREYMTKNFSLKELSCPHCGVCKVRPSSANRLQRMRDILDRPVRVSSGYRCPEHNSKVGGVVKSRHIEGIAFDVRCMPHERYEMIKAAMEVGFTCVMVYPTWLHVDDRAGEPQLLIRN